MYRGVKVCTGLHVTHLMQESLVSPDKLSHILLGHHDIGHVEVGGDLPEHHGQVRVGDLLPEVPGLHQPDPRQTVQIIAACSSSSQGEIQLTLVGKSALTSHDAEVSELLEAEAGGGLAEDLAQQGPAVQDTVALDGGELYRGELYRG